VTNGEVAMSKIKVRDRRAEQADVEGTVQGRGQHRERLLDAGRGCRERRRRWKWPQTRKFAWYNQEWARGTYATVTVRTQTEFNIGRTLESHFTKTSATSDSNGVAHVEFQFYDSDFSWRVDAPLHFNGRFGSGYGYEKFGCVVEESDYADINTNTVEGLAKYTELASLYGTDYSGYVAKFQLRSITYTNNVS